MRPEPSGTQEKALRAVRPQSKKHKAWKMGGVSIYLIFYNLRL